MFRFIMPETSDPTAGVRLLREQTQDFLRSEALQKLYALLGTDRESIAAQFDGRRTAGGTVLETQDLSPAENLEPLRYELYPLLRELGFFDINRPLDQQTDRILILGGSLNACFLRTEAARNWISGETRSVDALTCYRPINPVERSRSSYISRSDTEFGVMADAFASVFCADSDTEFTGWSEDFHGDRNLNSIACVRTMSVAQGRTDLFQCRILAAPSSQPERRRADTGDTLSFYLQQTDLQPGERLLAVTHNRYCNRQFLQLAHHLLTTRIRQPEACYPSLHLDVVGCLPDDRIFTADTYDPLQYLQDLIAILDWIDRFEHI